MVGWHHWFNGHEFEQTPEDSAGQGSLKCCSAWGHKESWGHDWQLNNSARGYPFLHTFSSIYCSLSSLTIAILTHVRWYLTVVFPFKDFTLLSSFRLTSELIRKVQVPKYSITCHMHSLRHGSPTSVLHYNKWDTFAKTHRMYNTRSSSSVNFGWWSLQFFFHLFILVGG